VDEPLYGAPYDLTADQGYDVRKAEARVYHNHALRWREFRAMEEGSMGDG